MPDILDETPVEESSDRLSGYVTQPHKSILGSTISALLQNADLDELYTRKKRGALTTFMGNASTGIAKTPSSSTPPVLFHHGSGGFIWQAGDTMINVDSSGVVTDLTPTFTSSTMYQLIEANNLVFRLQQANGNVYSWDKNVAHAWSDEGNTNTKFPRTICAIWTSQGRMLAANGPLGTSADFNRLYYSNSQDPQTWDRTVQVLTIGQSSEGGIYAMTEIEQNLVCVFLAEAVYLLDISNPNPSFWSARRIVSGLGTFGPQCVTPVGGDYAFVGSDGVYFLNEVRGRSSYSPISIGIQDDFDTMMNRKLTTQSPASSATRHRNSSIHYDGRRIILIHPSVNYALAFDMPSKRWEKIIANTTGMNHDGKFYGVASSALFANPRDSVTMFLLGNTNYTEVFQYPDYKLSTGKSQDTDISSNAVAITYQEESGGLVFQNPDNWKTGVAIGVDYLANSSGGSLLIEYQIDESGTWVTLVTVDLTKKKDQVTAATNLELVRYITSLNAIQFRELRLRFTDSSNYTLRMIRWKAYAFLSNLVIGNS